jgi:hypothetical protein
LNFVSLKSCDQNESAAHQDKVSTQASSTQAQGPEIQLRNKLVEDEPKRSQTNCCLRIDKLDNVLAIIDCFVQEIQVVFLDCYVLGV